MKINPIKKITNKVENMVGLDIVIVMILTTLLIIFVFTLPDGNILRIVFGLPFLLFLPGYSLVSAMWARKSELDGLERVALSLGLSIAIVALAGLGLNYTPWGITLNSVVICLYFLILILVGITWLRRSKLGPEERFSLKVDFLSENLNAMSSTDKVMALIIAIAIIIGAGMLIYIAMHPPGEQYTELYLLDKNGTTDNYPSNLTRNENSSIIIVVVCHEQQTTDYKTVITLMLESGINRTLAVYNFTIADEEEWQQVFNFSVNESGNYKLDVGLLKDDETTPYATTHIWIDVRN